jgi:hypothetical protein
MNTTKFMGKNQLIDRLAAQVGSRSIALGLLEKRGMVHPGTEKLTTKGEERNNMTAGERAVDRASKLSGTAPSKYAYNSKTNRATLKR